MFFPYGVERVLSIRCRFHDEERRKPFFHEIADAVFVFDDEDDVSLCVFVGRSGFVERKVGLAERFVSVGHHILHIEGNGQYEGIGGLTRVEHERPLMQQSQRACQGQADADTLFFFLFLFPLEERFEYLLCFLFGYFGSVAAYADREVAIILAQIDRNMLIAVFQGVIKQVAQYLGDGFFVE